MIFSDVLYGQIEIPNWLIPFVKSPEFLRLRGVRLSNVDSFQFKDFNAPTRWEHGIAVAYLALKFSEFKNLNQIDKVHLVIAGLLHDIATPPFAHTLEYVLENFDHEIESSKLLTSENSENIKDSVPIYASQYPQFLKICSSVNKEFKLSIDPNEVARIIIGEGPFGYVMNGTVDLDNIDNVTRASLFMGINIDKSTPLRLVKWLAEQNNSYVDLDNVSSEALEEWKSYRYKMYDMFYNSSEDELGRQAFLQHILRRAHKEGLSNWSMIFSTEERLLNQIEALQDDSNISRIKLKELLNSYRLLETTIKIAELPIEDKETLIQFKNPLFAKWLEERLCSKYFEPFVLINNRRHKGQNPELFERVPGSILIFKLYSTNVHINQMPDWFKLEYEKYDKKNDSFDKIFRVIIDAMIKREKKSKPWLSLSETRKENIKNNLESVGNWSFKLTKNDTIHSYPATFVHAIPSSLISSLGLQGQLIMDPFGGAGQTAIEGIKQECQIITSDINSISNLISNVKLTYLSISNRKFISSIGNGLLKNHKINYTPTIPDNLKWHNKATFKELCKIYNFIIEVATTNNAVGNFLKLCFSDILTSTTARRGKDYAYFADNTPLPKGLIEPDYVNAYELFLNKVNKNLGVINKLYASIERNGKVVKDELKRVNIFKNDIRSSSYNEFNIEKKSVSGIITSPPYLCMIDYTFGNRLSYYWLFPDEFVSDFDLEIGSRRKRSVKNIRQEYLDDLKKFANNASDILKTNGFLATVLGIPTASKFSDSKLFDEIDEIYSEAGLTTFWSTTRQIHWHRNPGLGKLKTERITVYVND